MLLSQVLGLYNPCTRLLTSHRIPSRSQKSGLQQEMLLNLGPGCNLCLCVWLSLGILVKVNITTLG